MARPLTLVCFVAFVAACAGGGGSTAPAGDAGADGGGGNGVTDGGTTGACVGEVVQCSQLIASCLEQRDCELGPYGCSAAPPRCSQGTDRESCIELLGCAWEADGKKEYTPGAGNCVGTAVPCAELTTRTECEQRPRLVNTATCRWDLTSGMCMKEGVETGCNAFSSPSQPPAGTTVFVTRRAGKGGCEGTKGCTWQPE